MVTHIRRSSPNHHLSLFLLLTYYGIARSSLSFVAAAATAAAAEEENVKNAPSPAGFRRNTAGVTNVLNRDENKVRGPAPVRSLDNVNDGNDVIGGGDDAASEDSSGDNDGNKNPTAKAKDDDDDDDDDPEKPIKKSFEDLIRPFTPEELQKIAQDIYSTDTTKLLSDASNVEFWEEVKRLEEMGTEWVIRQNYDADYDAIIEAQMEKKKPSAAVEEDAVSITSEERMAIGMVASVVATAKEDRIVALKREVHEEQAELQKEIDDETIRSMTETGLTDDEIVEFRNHRKSEMREAVQRKEEEIAALENELDELLLTRLIDEKIIDGEQQPIIISPEIYAELGKSFTEEMLRLRKNGREDEIPKFTKMRIRQVHQYLEEEAMGKVMVNEKKERDERARAKARANEMFRNIELEARAEAHANRKQREVEEEEQHHHQQASSSEPSSQPSNVHNSYEYRYEQTYDALFQPHVEEYELLKMDPYSLSGAPLGGWGRATRSRLASLPIRLVSDFDGGVDLWYNDNGGSEKTAEEDGESSEVESTEDSTTSTTKEKEDSTTATSSIPKDLRPSTGPHFTIHDATGQKYVCRIYAEEELLVISRLDSVFHPAVTVWDAERDGLPGNVNTDPAMTKVDASDRLGANDKDDGFHRKKKFQFSINSQGSSVDDDADIPDGLRDSVAKMLRRMGMKDAAAAMAGPNGGLGNAVDLANIEGLGDGANGDPPPPEIMEIINAAVAGAKIGSEGNTIGAGERGDSEKPPPAAPTTTVGMPAQLSPEEIYQILSQLNGLCSQLHLGWWSYEWCHHEQVRQFHVAIRPEEDAGAGLAKEYEIQDVTAIGKFKRDVQIIYPTGVYDGEGKKGTTQSVTFNRRGDVIKTQTSLHTREDDKKYENPTPPRNDGALDDKKERKKQKSSKGSERGPIIREIFEGGDFCPEVNYKRHMYVELRCCTDDEIYDWFRSKKRGSSSDNKDKARRLYSPLAVLVGVQEDQTCIYRARVCTPLLCPKPIEVTDNGSTKSTSTTETTSGTTSKKQKEQTKSDPIGNFLRAIFDDELPLDNFGKVQVFVPDGVIGQEFDTLMRFAERGGDFLNHPSFKRVKKGMRKSLGKKMDLKDFFVGDKDGGGPSPSVMDVDNMSIREILRKSLGERPCLQKNLGWWTYEFCYGENVRQYHANAFIDSNTGFTKRIIETEHLLGLYLNSGNDVKDYPDEDEHLHVVNATVSNKADWGVGNRMGRNLHNGGLGKNEKQPGGNGAVYVQEYSHGDSCDQDDVAESVIKGGNVVHGSVDRSTTVRFSCGKKSELMDIKEDSTCHYVLEVAVPELCEHRLFRATTTRTQVVKCLPV